MLSVRALAPAMKPAPVEFNEEALDLLGRMQLSLANLAPTSITSRSKRTNA